MKGWWLWVLALFALAQGACTVGVPSTASRLRVAASIPHLADFVRQVGGDRVEVEILVPSGGSVHTYEPTPRQVLFLAEARLLVLNGVGLEFWADKVVASVSNPNLLVVDTSQGIAIIKGPEEEGEEGHEHAIGDPHIWLSPLNAIVQVGHIREALIKEDPAGADVYRSNANDYVAQIRALDQEIRRRVKAWRYRKFIGFHAAWRYFGQTYGLDQVAVIEEFPGKEPSPQYLAEVVRKARTLEAGAIFAEPQLSSKAAQIIAAEAGKEVLILDPLGGVPGRTTYIDLMRYNMDQMEKALR